jgi:hypothetical protein
MGNRTLSMDSILKMLSSLSINNKKWLADKLYEDVAGNEKKCELDKAIEAAHNKPLKKANTVGELMTDLLV